MDSQDNFNNILFVSPLQRVILPPPFAWMLVQLSLFLCPLCLSIHKYSHLTHIRVNFRAERPSCFCVKWLQNSTVRRSSVLSPPLFYLFCRCQVWKYLFGLNIPQLFTRIEKRQGERRIERDSVIQVKDLRTS